MDKFVIWATIGAIETAASLRNLVGMLSRPVALFGWRAMRYTVALQNKMKTTFF